MHDQRLYGVVCWQQEIKALSNRKHSDDGKETLTMKLDRQIDGQFFSLQYSHIRMFLFLGITRVFMTHKHLSDAKNLTTSCQANLIP